MCLIVFSPKINRARIQKSTLESAFFRNDDGAGIAYIEEGEIKISKAYYKFEDFFLALQQIRSRIHSGPLLIHLRRGTGGSNNRTNTQPLVIYRGKLVMAHNGVFPNLEEETEDISDSVVLSRIIRRMGWNYPFLKVQTELLTRLCNDSSKLVFMNNKGKYTIINEKAGKWWRGSWYSNDMFINIPKPQKEIVYERREYPRYPGDPSFYQLPKSIPTGITYANMTKEQKHEYELWLNKVGAKVGSVPQSSHSQFRKRSVINSRPSDPDMLDDETWRARLHEKPIGLRDDSDFNAPWKNIN